MDPLGPERSLVNEQDAEWRTREINMVQLVRSFLSQIYPGQDISKISLPSVLCHPFSMLEIISHRELLLFHVLFELDNIQDPLERLLVVLKWYLSITRTETLEKKPFNPIISETHICCANHTPDDQSEYISEQVSHHPPISAFILRNKSHQITIQGSASFAVKLFTNSAKVTTSGPVGIRTERDGYDVTGFVPNISINNTVMPGRKYIYWNGEIKISCPESGYVASLTFEERPYRVNGIQGCVYHKADPNKNIYIIDGICGQTSQYWTPENPLEKKTLIDHSQLKEAYIEYLPSQLRPEFDSLRLWVPVANAIIKNDMITADQEKKKIEEAQRVRLAEKNGSENQEEGTYFRKDPNSTTWQFKDNVSVPELLRQLPIETQSENGSKAKLLE